MALLEHAERDRVRRQPDGVLIAASVLLGLAVTTLSVLTPYVGFGVRSPGAHIVLDSVAACIALLVAFLVAGRFRRSRRLQDLLLCQGLVLLAVSLLLFTQLTELAQRPSGSVAVWLVLWLRLSGAALVASASLSGGRVCSPTTHRTVLVAVPLVVLAGVAVIGSAATMPAALDSNPPSTSQYPVITGHFLLLGAHGFMALLFALATVGFTWQSFREPDELRRWLGPAFALAAFAWTSYLLFPSLFTDWIYTGDLLRTGSYLLLLIGAAREIEQHWQGQADAAVINDRRRLARELHDGVIQELGYIRSQSYSLPTHDETARQIQESCQRGLDEARAALHALEATAGGSLGAVLTRSAGEIADRYGVTLDVDVDDAMCASPAQQHELLRICREAISNAARHGAATRVQLHLQREDAGWRMTVDDDGTGFDPAEASRQGRGFGLTSMQERARALPGTLSIERARPRGMTVVVQW